LIQRKGRDWYSPSLSSIDESPAARPGFSISFRQLIKIQLLSALALAAMLPPSVQVQIDMGRVTCDEYLARPPDLSRDFAAWMSG
jgi:hypothetical protein